MSDNPLDAVKELLAAARDTLADLSLAERRQIRDNLPQPLPTGTTVTPIAAGGIPAEWLARPDAPARTVLYLHGGGFVVGSPRSHRSLAARVAAAVDADCLVLDYRLAPVHPHPAALDDAVAAYRWLLGEVASPEDIVVVGDSAGGGLATATLLRLRDSGDPLPSGAVLMSPWVDLALSGGSMLTRRDLDVSLTEASLLESCDAYAGDRSPTDPLISPLYGDLAGLPPLFVQVGDTELLLDDAVRLVDRATAAGVDATLEIWPDVPHVFQGFAGTLPAADEAIAHIGRFVSTLRSRRTAAAVS